MANPVSHVRAYGVGVSGGGGPGRGAAYMERFTVSLSTGGTLRVDPKTREWSSCIISITTGALDLWFGEFEQGTAQFHVKQADPPVQLWFPECAYVLFCVAPMAVTGTITLLGG